MGQPGFFDLGERYRGLDAKKDPLVVLNAVVPWEDFRAQLSAVWRKPDEERKTAAGRKPWDEVVIFKTLVLQALYNLSDDQVEYQIRDPAPAHSPAGTMAEAGRHRLRRLPCCADQQSCISGVPLSHCRPLAAHASATQPEGWFDVGEDRFHRQRLAPEAAHPSPLAAAAFCRQTPKVGAGCPNGARPDLCGGRSAMSVPTAIRHLVEVPPAVRFRALG